MSPLQCLETSCPVDANCMATLVVRVNKIFDHVEGSELLIAYFKLPSGRIRAGVFTSDLSEARVTTCNKTALTKFQQEGTSYEWQPGVDFFKQENGQKLILPESLLTR